MKDEFSIFKLTDLSSTNGTFVNKVKVKDYNLEDRDEVVFGGGEGLGYGAVLKSTDAAECRYAFMSPICSVSIPDTLDVNEILPPIDEAEPCPICYQPIKKRSRIPCGHVFCPVCIGQWAQKCVIERKSVICPCCRKIFNPEELFYGETIYKGDNLIILSLDHLIRKLGLQSASEIIASAPTHIWNEKMKENFWNYVGLVEKKPDRFKLFCALTNIHPEQIDVLSKSELENLIINMDEKLPKNKEELKDTALWCVLTKIYNYCSFDKRKSKE